jgi:hypothetical protein
MHFIWHDLQHGFFHFDNGIFYTIRQLLTRPGHTIREFIEGKRVRHFKPFAFVVVLATLYGLLYHYLINDLFELTPIDAKENVVSAYEKVIKWIVDHFAVSTLLITVTTTIASYLVFRKKGYNLAEHLVLNTFYRGLILVINLLLFPVLYIYSDTNNLKWYGPLLQIIDIVLMYWCYSQFFKNMPKIEVLLLTLLTYFIALSINVVVGYVASWIIIST